MDAHPAMPSDESRSHAVLRQLQLTELEILEDVVRICEANHLTYFLIAGTLLGAVRHQGFIPWDDDVDIAMPRKDYQQFLNQYREQLDPGYYVHCSITDPLYWLPFAKVRKRNTVFDELDTSHLSAPKGIFIDVFPLDNAGAQASILQRTQAALVQAIGMVILYRRGIHFSWNFWRQRSSLKKLSQALLKVLAVSVTCFLPVHALSRLQQAVMSWNGDDCSPCYVSLWSRYRWFRQPIPKDRYLPAARVEFEGKAFCAPRDWDYVLKGVYGDYMTLPPESERATHRPVRISFNTEKQEDH